MSVRILYIDGSLIDRQLVRNTLETSNPGTYNLIELDLKKDLQAHLSQKDFDLVLCDLHTPGYEDVDVLDLVQSTDPRIPVIIVTGPGNEAKAIEAMQRGASDFVIKTPAHILRLPKTIENVLERKRLQDERDSVEQIVRRSEQKFRSFIEYSADGLIMTDEQGVILEWNKAMETISQVFREEALGQPLWEVQFRSVPAGNRTEAIFESMKQSLEQVLQRGESPFLNRVSEMDIERKDGSIRHLQFQFFVIKTEKGFMCGGVARDVTEQNLIEKESRRKTDEFAALYETTRDLTQQRNLQELLELILERAINLLNLPCGGILSYDPKREVLDVVTTKGVTLPPHAHVHLGEGLPGVVGKTQQPMIVKDYRSSEYFTPELDLGVNITSILAAPLIDGGELFGVILVAEKDNSQRQFSEADVHLITLFASQAAIFVHNSHLYEEARTQAAQLRLLYDAGLALNTIIDPKTQLELLFNIGMDVLSCDKMEFLRFDPRAKELTYETSTGFSPEGQERLASLHISLSANLGVSGWVAQNQLPLNVPDVRKDPRYISIDPEIRSGLWVPVIHGDRLLGVLAVFRVGNKVFTSDDEHLLSLFASQAAIAIENARLFAETERRVSQAQSLRTIDQAISSSLDLRLVLNIVLEELVNELKVSAAGILMLNPVTNFLEYKTGRGFQTPFLHQTHLRLGEGNAGRVGLERKMAYIPDLTAAPNSLEQSLYYRRENFRTYFGVPLISKGKLKGVLEIFDRSVLQPDNLWLDFLDAIGGQAAIAVDNITLFTDLQARTNELAAAYDATIEGWSHALDMRDQDTEGHTQRVTELTLRLAASLGFDQDGLVHIRRGALLHDIGKMGIPDKILLKPGPLTPEEMEIMHRHPVYARELIIPVRFLHPALDIPYCHHEKWDGTGYPRGLKGTDIPLAARIFAVVDVWDALLSARPYRPAWTREKTLQYILNLSGKDFDPEVVKIFIERIGHEHT